MIHRLIAYLKGETNFNQWLFLLTTYEIAKHEWVERLQIVRAARLPEHASNVSELTSKLVNAGLIDVITQPNGRNAGTIHVRLTPESRRMIRAAFKHATATDATAQETVPA